MHILRKWPFSLFFDHRQKPVKGLPADLDIVLLSSITGRIWGSECESSRYVHLSGWKKSGAYRLIIKLKSGEIQTLIYKNSIYSNSEIPALKKLNVTPGQSEYIIYTIDAETLESYLPKIYYTEIQDRYHYIFVLEDIAEQYVKFSSVDDIFNIVGLLCDFHKALFDDVKKHPCDGLIQYDQSFFENLIGYAEKHIFSGNLAISPDLVSDLSDNWKKIRDILESLQEFGMDSMTIPVHGDLNLTNVLLNRNDKTKFLALDWEWAGYSYPHWDLASLLKGKKLAIIEHSLEIYAKINKDLTLRDHNRFFLEFLLRRCVLDAAFMAAQLTYTFHETTLDKKNFIEKSLTEAMRALNLIKKTL